MKLGTGKGPAWRLRAVCVPALCAFAAGASVVSAGADQQPVATSSLQRVAPPDRVASGAVVTTIFVIAGTPTSNSLSAWTDSTGRLVISSPQGILEPDGDKPDCIQDSPTQVSCRAGFISAFAGDLGAGKDSFEAQSTLTTLIGVSLASEERSLGGGTGRDRISGGRGGDLINGGAGHDALFGFGGGDLLRGQAGRDSISGGGSPDVLMGGGGPDKLHGGAARDLCNGGSGRDTAKSCNVTRKIP